MSLLLYAPDENFSLKLNNVTPAAQGATEKPCNK